MMSLISAPLRVNADVVFYMLIAYCWVHHLLLCRNVYCTFVKILRIIGYEVILLRQNGPRQNKDQLCHKTIKKWRYAFPILFLYRIRYSSFIIDFSFYFFFFVKPAWLRGALSASSTGVTSVKLQTKLNSQSCRAYCEPSGVWIGK